MNLLSPTFHQFFNAGSSPPTVVPSIAVPPRDTVFIEGDSVAKMECVVNARLVEKPNHQI